MRTAVFVSVAILAAGGMLGLRRGIDRPAPTPVLSVTGVVRVEATGQPVPEAMVSVDELRRRTSTDSLGRYQFSGLAYRTYTISVRTIGYIVERREVHAECSVEIQDEHGRVLTPSRCSPSEEVLNFYLRPERHIN